MKKILLFAFAVIALTACKSREQKIVEDFIMPRVKCPATFKTVEFTTRIEPEKTKRDTVYHIYKVNGKKKSDGSYSKYDTRSVVIDSVAEDLITYPQHTVCYITFDAQNLMGATMRNSETVILENGIPMSIYDWDRLCENRANSLPAWPERITISKFGLWCPMYFHVDDWIPKSELVKD